MTDVSEEVAPDWAVVLTAVFAIVIAILGFIGNLLTILALPYSTRLRNSATWFVVNLAVVEGLFCVTILPMSAAHLFSLYVSNEKLFSDDGCSVFVFLRYVIIQTELLSIAAIAVNRCLLIAFPRRYHSLFTTSKTIITIVMIWVVSAALMLIPLLKIYGEFTYNKKTKECDFADNKESGGSGPRKLFLALGFLLPCLIIIISYSYIFYKARRSSNVIRSQSLLKSSINSTTENKQVRPAEGLRKRDIRIARTIGVIFLVFLICCMPVSIAHYIDNRYHNPTLLLLLHPVYWAQYCINVFIYVFMNKQYRDAYVNYIARWWPNFRERVPSALLEPLPTCVAPGCPVAASLPSTDKYKCNPSALPQHNHPPTHKVSIRKFKWREERTSCDSQRQTRAGTPNSIMRFTTRKISKSSSFKKPQSPLVENVRKESPLEATPEVTDSAIQEVNN